MDGNGRLETRQMRLEPQVFLSLMPVSANNYSKIYYAYTER
jgi:hypothetical protein